MNERGIRVLHVCECVPGGPATYLNEVLPYQRGVLGADNVKLVLPSHHQQFLSESLRDMMVPYVQRARGTRALFNLARTLHRMEVEFQPSILHLHSTVAGAVGRIVYSWRRARPSIIYCAHGWVVDPDRPSRFKLLMTLIERLLVPLTDYLLNISQHEISFLERLKFPPEKLRLVVSGLTDIPLQDKIISDSGTRPYRLVFIGRFDRQKGFDLLLSEMQSLGASDVVMVAIGSAVRDSGDNIDVAGIRFTGWLSPAEARLHLLEADAIVMPSRWEGLPLAALEAMRAGTTIIASDRGAFPFIIEDGITGVLVDTREPGFLGRALAGRSRVEFHRMGQMARTEFLKRFSSDRMNAEIIALYQEAVG